MMNNSQGASSFFSGLSTLLGRPHPLLHNLSDTTHGGGSHGVVRPGEVRAQEYGGLGRGLPQRIWQAEAAYRRTDLFERRRRLMNDWAAYLADKSRDPEAGPVR